MLKESAEPAKLLRWLPASLPSRWNQRAQRERFSKAKNMVAWYRRRINGRFYGLAAMQHLLLRRSLVAHIHRQTIGSIAETLKGNFINGETQRANGTIAQHHIPTGRMRAAKNMRR